MQQKNNSIDVIQPSLPKGGGAIHGMGEAFSADEFMGGATLSIPIPATACRDFSPQVSLDYSSGAGNSAFGQGFALSLPDISRLTAWGVPRYDAGDTLVLSGHDYLVPALGADNQPLVSEQTIGQTSYRVARYRPRLETDFSIIEFYCNLLDRSDQFWRVTDATNTVSVFGKSSAAKIFDPADDTHIFKWLLQESYDDKGNHIVYRYQKENTDNVALVGVEVNRDHCANSYLSAVCYGNNQPILDGSLVTGASATALAAVEWHFELVFDYGQYAIEPSNATPYTVPAANSWLCRADPFSAYASGFEIRTLRLCRNILLFHRFAELNNKIPTLISVLALSFNSTPHLSFISGVTQIGYRWQGAASQPCYRSKALPTLTLDYTPFLPSTRAYLPAAFERCTAGPAAAESTSQPLANAASYHLVDLYAEGIPGLLYADGQSVYYREPQAIDANGVQYGANQALAFPASRQIADAMHTLVDIDGSGKLDLVSSVPGQSGCYAMEADKQWRPFTPFAGFPLDYHQRGLDYIDITGDGLADLVLIGEDAVRINTGLGRQGYGPTQLCARVNDVPTSKPDSPVEIFRFANLLGGGLAQRVRIANGVVECWPSLGYGKFGAKVTLQNAPNFGADFNAERLQLADIDGSGYADIIYIYPDRVAIYLNQSGNGFASAAISIPLPAPWDTLDQISFADIKGNGTQCLIFRKFQPTLAQWFLDFNRASSPAPDQIANEPQVPYLLQTIANNLGATTALRYASSTHYYLQDKVNGLPWATTLATPINVLAVVIQCDAIADTRMVTSYRYHHGYFDGVERQFRGFGCVEKTDVATFDNFLPGTDSNAAYHAPPLHSKTWYHTGAGIEERALLQQYRREYWSADALAYAMPDTDFVLLDNTPTERIWRESRRALYGSVLRSEIYGIDATPWQNTPYTVAETRYQIVQLQAQAANRFAVFRIAEQESIHCDYARNAADPKITHAFVLATDRYGQVLQTCQVDYGRRVGPIPVGMDPQTQAQQTQLWVTYSQHRLINSPDILPAVNFYRLGIPLEDREYKISGAAPTQGQYFTFADIQNQIAAAFQSGVTTAPQALLHGWQRHYYFDADVQTELPLGQISAPVLPHRSEAMAFDRAMLANNDFSYLSSAELAALLTGDGSATCGALGGYIVADNGAADAAQYYWHPGSAQRYCAGKKFFLPCAIFDPFQYPFICFNAPNAVGVTIPCTTYHYDRYHLMATAVVDPLNSKTTVDIIDYQVLLPQTITDINGNIDTVLFDALGLVIASSRCGTQPGATVGFSDLSNYAPVDNPSAADIFANPEKYLQGAESFFYYDFDAWQTQGVPAHSVFLNYDDYTVVNGAANPLPPTIQQRIVYSDGVGRILQTKTYFDGEATTRSWDSATDTVLETPQQSAWLTSGATCYDNKGQPIKQYRPYFAATHNYVDNQALNCVGVATTLFYDALGEGVLTLSPEGFIEKNLPGNLAGGSSATPLLPGWLNQQLYAPQTAFQPSPWSHLQFDANDTILQSGYQPATRADVDAEAIAKAQACANTPLLAILGSIGKVVESRQLNVPLLQQNAQYFLYDIWGNELTSSDQRLHAARLNNFQTTYNLLNVAVLIDSVDAGKRWLLHDVMGNPFYQKDARGTEIFHSYDVLHRHRHTQVKNSGTELPLHNCVKKTWYGDSVGANGQPIFAKAPAHNLLGKAVIRLDEGGLTLVPAYAMLGLPLQQVQWINSAYKSEADWTGIDDTIIAVMATGLADLSADAAPTSLTLPTALSALLLSEAYATSQTYDALGRLRSATDADGNRQVPNYYSTDWLANLNSMNNVLGGAALAAEQQYSPATSYAPPGIAAISYNAMGQQTAWYYNNGVTTQLRYDALNDNLIGIHSQRLNSAGTATVTLQELRYHHDPVGNVTRVINAAIPTVYFNNQAVEASADYSYDTLYRLVAASGREQASCWSNVQCNQNKFTEVFLASAVGKKNNPQALQQYQQTYSYDAGNNLLQLQHASGAPLTNAPSRKWVIQAQNNQLATAGMGISSSTYQFDGNGNMQTLDGTAGIAWNYRNNMAAATAIERDGDNNDTEYYVYDGAGQRIRKISEAKTSKGTHIKEVLYVGGLEIRRSGYRSAATGAVTYTERWHTVRMQSGDGCYCVWRYWVSGPIKAGNKAYQLRYQLSDVLNSSQLEVDEMARIITYEEYYPYGGSSIIDGNHQTEVKNKHYRYSGKEADATGLYYYGMRYYAPWLGRWISTDPAGTVDGLNIYAFVRDNPVTHIDVGGMGAGKNFKPKNRGRKSWRGPAAMGQKEWYQLIAPPRATVTSLLKIDGAEYSHAHNEAVGAGGMKFSLSDATGKQNPHAEDWILNSFKAKYEEYKKANPTKLLGDYLTSVGHFSSSNTADTSKHFFSLRISHSPCSGCVNTIINFKKWIESELGVNNFILRVKFIFPYKLPKTLKDASSNSAKNFLSGMKKLRDAGVFVRNAGAQSIDRMRKAAKAAKVKVASITAMNAAVSLADKYFSTLASQSWTALNVKRK